MTSDHKDTMLSLMNLPQSVVRGVASVIGRSGRRALLSVDGIISMADVFNCLVSLRRVENYIANESTNLQIPTGAWNKKALAEFFDMLLRGEVDGVTLASGEKESLRVMIQKLRT